MLGIDKALAVLEAAGALAVPSTAGIGGASARARAAGRSAAKAKAAPMTPAWTCDQGFTAKAWLADDKGGASCFISESRNLKRRLGRHK